MISFLRIGFKIVFPEISFLHSISVLTFNLDCLLCYIISGVSSKDNLLLGTILGDANPPHAIILQEMLPLEIRRKTILVESLQVVSFSTVYSVALT